MKLFKCALPKGPRMLCVVVLRLRGMVKRLLSLVFWVSLCSQVTDSRVNSGHNRGKVPP